LQFAAMSEGRFDRGRGSKDIGGFTDQTQRHHAAVRGAGDIDALGVGDPFGDQRRHQSAHVGNIVGVATCLQAFLTAVIPFTPQGIGVDRHELFAFDQRLDAVGSQ
jgi:hypothetical protein